MLLFICVLLCQSISANLCINVYSKGQCSCKMYQYDLWKATFYDSEESCSSFLENESLKVFHCLPDQEKRLNITYFPEKCFDQRVKRMYRKHIISSFSIQGNNTKLESSFYDQTLFWHSDYFCIPGQNVCPHGDIVQLALWSFFLIFMIVIVLIMFCTFFDIVISRCRKSARGEK